MNPANLNTSSLPDNPIHNNPHNNNHNNHPLLQEGMNHYLCQPYNLPFQSLAVLGANKTSDYNNAIIHLYRGELGRQVTYRTRLDTTTNWAVTTAAGLTILSLGNSQIPHYFHLLIAFFLLLFCVME